MSVVYDRYLRWITLWVLSLCLGVGLLNYVVDPFDRNGRFDHWGLARPEISYPINRPLFELHRFDRFLEQPTAAERWVVVGDSRSNQLDETILNTSGRTRWFNFSFGGATFGDSVALAERLINVPGIRGIVFSVSFFRFDGASGEQQVRRALQEYDSPLHYFSATTTRATVETLLYALAGTRLTEARPRMSPQRFWDYVMARKREDLLRWTWPESALASLEALHAQAHARGVRFLLMVPPDSPAISRLLSELRPADVARFNASLRHFQCVDFRRPFGATLADRAFRDPLHLDDPAVVSFSHAFLGEMALHRVTPRVGTTSLIAGAPPDLLPDATGKP